eukprot:2298106-Pyramimonas_sp.AAC.1
MLKMFSERGPALERVICDRLVEERRFALARIVPARPITAERLCDLAERARRHLVLDDRPRVDHSGHLLGRLSIRLL